MADEASNLLDSVARLADRVRILEAREQFIGHDVIAPAYAAPMGTPHFDTALQNLWVNYDDTAVGWQLIGGGGGPVPHNLLSASHPDTDAAAAARGYIIRGNATPHWERYAHPGKAGHFLTTDLNDVIWSTSTLSVTGNTTITGGGTISLGGFTLTVPATGTAALVVL